MVIGMNHNPLNTKSVPTVKVLVTQSCLSLCDRMECSMPGFPAHHQLPELTQTHVHKVDDAIQPSDPLRPLLLLLSVIPSIRVLSNE